MAPCGASSTSCRPAIFGGCIASKAPPTSRSTSRCSARSGERRAIAYQGRRSTAGLAPSKRYRDALVVGACEQGLPASYIDELRALEVAYVPIASELARAGFATMETLHRRGISVTNALDWWRERRR